ncbi:MAG: hypothetical protein IPL39_02495 [Opitutaceae bacterium]|nr:hypothetical protein [Opitutaceae bacterium]
MLLSLQGALSYGDVADAALGGRALFALSAASVGLRDGVEGIEALQLELEKGFPVGTQISEVMVSVSAALNQLKVSPGSA